MHSNELLCVTENSITRIIQSFRSSQTVEDLLQAYGDLSKWVNSLHASAEPKTLISVISPVLANFNFESSSFSVTLPGIPANVTVVRVEPHVHVLATKTRPKRLTFRGSNGKSYSYLVKGSENLNVDTGVMQFMNIVEHLVQWPARSYSVTPLGKLCAIRKCSVANGNCDKLLPKFQARRED